MTYPSASSIGRIRYRDVRRESVLVRLEPERSSVVLLLRPHGADDVAVREFLSSLGAVPDGGPGALSWSLATGDPNRVLTRVHDALGRLAHYDAGTSFDAEGAKCRLASLPRGWRGRFVLHVGCSRRCLVFDGKAEPSAIREAFEAEESEYFARDHHPATE